MRFHRFDPYQEYRERRARENAARIKEFYKANQRKIDDPDRKVKIQNKRTVTMRAKRVKITLPIVSLALLTLFPHRAYAHCYSTWRYPWPQHCGGVYNRVGIKHDLVYRVIDPIPVPPIREVDIPLPDMNATWGGAMDSELELQMQRQKALRQLRGE